MKKTFTLTLCLSAILAGAVDAEQAKPAPRDPQKIAAYKQAITETYRKLFAAGMSNLTPEQLQTFWTVYGDYEKEKSAIVSARTDLAKKYVEAYASEGGLQDAELTQIVSDAANYQKKNTDLRLKYFKIYSEKINVKTAARFALIDDFVATAVRMDLLGHLPMPTEQVTK
jgi:hypothetical protein